MRVELNDNAGCALIVFIIAAAYVVLQIWG